LSAVEGKLAWFQIGGNWLRSKLKEEIKASSLSTWEKSARWKSPQVLSANRVKLSWSPIGGELAEGKRGSNERFEP